MIFKDYYRILELNTNKVTINQIKESYRELAKKYHPDVNINNPRAEERFKDINEAYRILSDSATKRKYDRTWSNTIGKKKNMQENKKTEGTMKSDFINMFFGSFKEDKEQQEVKTKKKVPAKGENVETEINVSIQEAYKGLEKKISLRTVNRKDENIYCKSTSRN